MWQCLAMQRQHQQHSSLFIYSFCRRSFTVCHHNCWTIKVFSFYFILVSLFSLPCQQNSVDLRVQRTFLFRQVLCFVYLFSSAFLSHLVFPPAKLSFTPHHNSQSPSYNNNCDISATKGWHSSIIFGCRPRKYYCFGMWKKFIKLNISSPFPGSPHKRWLAAEMTMNPTIFHPATTKLSDGRENVLLLRCKWIPSWVEWRTREMQRAEK